MGIGQPMGQHNHSRKFYILLTTIILGAILILTLINDEGELSFFTGSSIGLNEGVNEEEKALKELSAGEEIEVRLNFDIVPEAKEETSFKSVKVIFDDLSTKIKINEEELELKGLENVEMELDDFSGKLNFDEISISLNGEGARMIINGIEISTKGKMVISFKNLVYDSLMLEGVELSLVNFREGSGELALGEKLNYAIENEKLALNNFKGDLSVGLSNESLMVMEGKVSGVSIEGEFSLTLS